jgi:hypothetical protein
LLVDGWMMTIPAPSRKLKAAQPLLETEGVE